MKSTGIEEWDYYITRMIDHVNIVLANIEIRVNDETSIVIPLDNRGAPPLFEFNDCTIAG